MGSQSTLDILPPAHAYIPGLRVGPQWVLHMYLFSEIFIDVYICIDHLQDLNAVLFQ